MTVPDVVCGGIFVMTGWWVLSHLLGAVMRATLQVYGVFAAFAAGVRDGMHGL